MDNKKSNMEHKDTDPMEGIFYTQTPNDIPSDRDKDDKVRSVSPINSFFRVLAMPIVGWKDLKRQDYSPEEMARGCFYPFLALAALSVFAELIYDPLVSLNYLIASGLVEFVRFFAGYFVAVLLFRYFPSYFSSKIETPYGKVFVMSMMTSLVLFEILVNVLPMAEPVLVFLPLYTFYLIFRGVKFLRIERSHDLMAAVWISIMVFALPWLIGWLFSIFLPEM